MNRQALIAMAGLNLLLCTHVSDGIGPVEPTSHKKIINVDETEANVPSPKIQANFVHFKYYKCLQREEEEAFLEETEIRRLVEQYRA
ncbi:hypothetical protein O181_099518 [Austropuccinia psidii MF-1]|uniref:Secreted protein n=1 Tax=Austropuccinia psidii MF-1 TaxID=1389203 RepID=A0A9Q3PF78_9BASI|nr:hypothetical protein [Austropuccinia psidii MF-1]